MPAVAPAAPSIAEAFRAARAQRLSRPKLYPKQHAAIFCTERYALVESSTKSGKTFAALAWILELAQEAKQGRNFWWIAPVFKQTEIAFRRLKDTLREGMSQASYKVNESDLVIELSGAGRITFKSAERPDNLFGEDVWGAVIDEASRLREEAFHALRTTLSFTRGPIRIIGNVKGRKNWFYRMARKAEAGEPDMRYARITWRDAVAAGVLDAEEIEDARRSLPAAVFQELYEAEASDDAGNPFGAAAIRACLAPMSLEAPVAFGVDLARAVDYTAAVGLDRDGVVCRLERFQRPWAETKVAILGICGSVPALIDSTGVGDPVVEDLQRAGCNAEGFKFSSVSKQALMEGLSVAIQQQLVRFPDGVLSAELEAFEYEYSRTGVRYTAPEGMHDDTVCALALAVKCRAERSGPVMIARAW